MSARFTGPGDHLVVAFFSRESLLMTSGGWLDDLLEIVERNAGEWMPTKADGGKREVRYSREAIKKQFFQRDTNHDSWMLQLFTEGEPELLLTFQVNQDPGSELHFYLRWRLLPLDFYRDEEHAQERAQRLVSFIRDVARRFPPYYARGHSYADLQMGVDDSPRYDFLPTQVSEVHWLDVFGKEMVDAMGRERVLSTPAAHLEELPHGGVLLLTRPTPADFESEEGRVAQAKALVHLRPEESFDTVLARLRERSATLVPIERKWDPDIEELLGHTLRAFLLKDVQRETARLNDYRPPPVSEWMPLQQAPGSDVEDVEAALAEYSEDAEGVVAIWYKEVPELWNGGPDSITPLDKHLWQFGYGKWVKPEGLEKRLIPAVGAYLGQVMVNHLGGRWVPRKKLDEAYVALGDRAWLPFLRARRCLGETRQAVVDYSLTKFYRAAEQHLRQVQAKG